MKVSVIVPVYNHAKYLRQRMESILEQTYKDYELIILDDGSTDESRKIILEFKSRLPETIINFSEYNTGSPFHQWNKGVSLAKGEFIWIAESDDLADIHFLDTTVAEISKSDDIGLVYTDSWIHDEEKGIRYRFSQKIKKNEKNELTSESFIINQIPNASSVLFRKSHYMRAGLADSSMKFCGDWMLYYNILRQSRIINLPEPLNTFRLHCDSQYHKYYKNNLFIKEVRQVYKKIFSCSKFSIKLSVMMLFNLSKRLVIRLLYILNTPSCFIPEMPRPPREFEYIF